MPDEFNLPSTLINNTPVQQFGPIQPTTIPPTVQPRISVRTSLFEQKKSEYHRTIKRSQSSNQREADNHASYDRAIYHEDLNASKKPRYDNRYQSRNNRHDYSPAKTNEYNRRDNNQYPSTSRNVAPLVRTNDPRLNRRVDNDNGSSFRNPTHGVPLPLINPKNHFNMEPILHRCTKALDLIRNLKQTETLPMVLFKFSDMKIQQQTSERAKKSPLILNSNNVEYLLQASEDSSDECHIAMLSRQFKNISFQLQSTMRVIGADIDIISFGVAKAELMRKKEESNNESFGIVGNVYTSGKNLRECATQTDDVNIEDNAIPKTFADKELSCNIVVLNTDKEVQTVVNTDGFSFSIESLLLLTPLQRQGLQDFKKVFFLLFFVN